ncbi:MAG: bifunctional folylpolyglutamate synthase/dihydrofolate synthase, partial [Oscillospiraceae bacterium]
LIAAEKAGIIKPNTTVIVYPTQEIKALDVIVKTAKAQKAKLIVPELEDLHLYKGDIFHNVIDYGGYEMNLPFVGEHQAQNACVVVETALELCNKGFDISDEAIIEGIEQTTFPARIEIISKEPLILLDGCHNVDSVTALANTLKKANLPPMVAVIGILEEKEPLALLNILKPYFSTVYTVTPDSPRAMTAEKLASLAKPIFENVFPIGNVKNAIASAKKNIGGKKALCVCGSLYLAAEARKYLKP